MSEDERALITPIIFNDEPVRPDLRAEETAYFQFDRYADTFARIIASRATRTPLTIGIHGEWGSGKTTLMRRMQAKLDETKSWKTAPVSFLKAEERGDAFRENFRECRTVWFNAWKYSRQEAMFVALIEEVLRQMRRDGAMQALYAALADPKQPQLKISEAVLSTLTRVFTAGQIDIDLTAFQTESRFKANLAFLDEFMEVFDRLLRWYVARDHTAEGEFDDSKGVLVIFVDDLDRCLPEKTVQVLEAIKLMMGKRGTVFVLGSSRRIVQAAVEAHYKLGKLEEITPRDYLDKIIQLRFDLPPIRPEDMAIFIEDLQERGLEPTLLKSLPVITQGVPTNPRRVKTFVNYLELQWGLLVNTGQTVEDEQPQFYEWMVLNEVSPTFARRLREMGKEARVELIEEAVQLARKEEVKRAALLEERPHLREVAEDERLLGVLRAGEFEFEADILDRFIYLSAPPPIVVPQIAEGLEEAVVLEVERQGAEVAVPIFLKMVADESVLLRGRIAAAEALGRLGDRRLDEWVKVPAGQFIMGEKGERRLVYMDAFKIAKYPLTEVQYAEFVQATGYEPPSHWKGGTYPGNKANHPVVNVSWHDAVAYCEWLTGRLREEGRLGTGEEIRLLTEEEWEKAARGTDGRGYSWGDEFDGSRSNTIESGIRHTTPVGVYPGGASPYGVMDMAGNVWEWTASKWSEDSEARVLRGGSWSHDGSFARCALRYLSHPGNRRDYFGTRVGWCAVPGFTAK